MRKNVLALTALSMMAAVGLSDAAAQSVRTIRPANTFGGLVSSFEGGVTNSRNGGRSGKGMAAKRASVKRRNVLRHRKACK